MCHVLDVSCLGGGLKRVLALLKSLDLAIITKRFFTFFDRRLFVRLMEKKNLLQPARKRVQK